MGMLSTVYFFLHNAPDVKSKGMIRKTSNTTSDNNPRVEI